MGWVLFFLGIAWVMLGTLMVFATDTIEKHCYKKLREISPRLLSPFPIVCGVLLFLAAPFSSQAGFIVVLGVLSVAKGVLFLLSPEKKGKMFANWWFNAPRSIHQVFGLLIIILGILVLASLAPLIN